MSDGVESVSVILVFLTRKQKNTRGGDEKNELRTNVQLRPEFIFHTRNTIFIFAPGIVGYAGRVNSVLVLSMQQSTAQDKKVYF